MGIMIVPPVRLDSGDGERMEIYAIEFYDKAGGYATAAVIHDVLNDIEYRSPTFTDKHCVEDATAEARRAVREATAEGWELLDKAWWV